MVLVLLLDFLSFFFLLHYHRQAPLAVSAFFSVPFLSSSKTTRHRTSSVSFPLSCLTCCSSIGVMAAEEFPCLHGCPGLVCSYCDWISDCPWWIGYSRRWTLHYGNFMSNRRQKDEKRSGRKEEDVVFFSLSPQQPVPAEWDLREQPQRRVPAAPTMNVRGSGWVAMTRTLARVVMQTPLFSGHVCTIFHCLSLLGCCSEKKKEPVYTETR